MRAGKRTARPISADRILRVDPPDPWPPPPPNRIVSPIVSDTSSTQPPWLLTGGTCASCREPLETQQPGGMNCRHAISKLIYSECPKKAK